MVFVPVISNMPPAQVQEEVDSRIPPVRSRSPELTLCRWDNTVIIAISSAEDSHLGLSSLLVYEVLRFYPWNDSFSPLNHQLFLCTWSNLSSYRLTSIGSTSKRKILQSWSSFIEHSRAFFFTLYFHFLYFYFLPGTLMLVFVITIIWIH